MVGFFWDPRPRDLVYVFFPGVLASPGLDRSACRLMMTSNATTHNLVLVPADTEAEAPGHGGSLELGALAGKPVLVVLRVTEVIEQESLHVSVWGSAEGSDWGTKALFWFPERFYRGVTPAALDLSQRPEVKFLQGRWEVNRWGRGTPRPHFKFGLEVQELPPG